MSTQRVFGLMSHLEACFDSIHPLCHYVPWSTPALYLVLLLPLSLFLSLFPVFFFCQLSASWPGSRRDTGSGWGPSFETGFKHGSCYRSWGGRWRWLCVCVLRGVGSCGSSRKTQLWPLLLRPSPLGVRGEWECGVMRASQAAAGERDGVWFQPL